MADAKVTALSEISLPTLDDILYYVDDPAGTPASKKASLSRLLGLFNHTNDFRLTLATGNPVYSPQPATPSSTDTSAETCTFAAAHGWESGTIVTPSATGGGLSTATRYFVNKTSATVVSFHTTVADALAATNKVNLTASITAEILPSGISNTTLYWSPLTGCCISIYDGTRWRLYTSIELSIALGTLTSARPYDVFIYDNSGTLTLELLAWTSDTVRATDLVRQDGVWCKTGALTRRYLGTIRTDSTTTTIDDAGGLASQVGGKRFVWNYSNRRRKGMQVMDSTPSWTYASATIRQANGAAGNKLEIVVGLAEDAMTVELLIGVTTGASAGAEVGIGLNSTTVFKSSSMRPQMGGGASIGAIPGMARWDGVPPIGYSALNWLEVVPGGATYTFISDIGTTRQGGLTAAFDC